MMSLPLMNLEQMHVDRRSLDNEPYRGTRIHVSLGQGALNIGHLFLGVPQSVSIACMKMSSAARGLITIPYQCIRYESPGVLPCRNG